MDYTIGMPTKAPDDMMTWLMSSGQLTSNTILYKMDYYIDKFGKRRRGVKCTCSECCQSFFAEYVGNLNGGIYGWFHDKEGKPVYNKYLTFCPLCEAEAENVYIGKNKKESILLSSVDAITIQKVNGRIAIIRWQAEKRYTSGKCENYIIPWEAYVFDGRKCVKMATYYTTGFYNHEVYTGEWKQRSKCVDTIGKINTDYIYPFESYVFDGTELENAKFDIYVNSGVRVYPVSYLRLYQRHNTVENLVMSGSLQAVNDMLDGGYRGYMSVAAPLSRSDKYNWKAKKPSAILGLNKPEYKALKNERLDYIDLYLKTKPYGITVKNMKEILKRNTEWNINILATEFKENIVRADRYIMKQRKKYGRRVDMYELFDYWRMIGPADALNDLNIRYPQNLKHAHDECVRLKKWKEDRELAEKFEKRYEELSAYSYQNDIFMIRPCHDEAELINEGKTLEHCVASYAKRHASGDTSIFFIRFVDKPDEPYYTLEWTGSCINQDRGYKNELQTDEIKEFESEWLEYVKGVQNGKRDKKAS